MNYLVLLAQADHFDEWDAMGDDQRQRAYGDFHAFAEAVQARGSIVYGDALDRPTTARTVHPGTDRAVTDGPYAEAAEQLGGLYVIDVEDLDTAVELAKLLPREFAIEVRPTLEVEI